MQRGIRSSVTGFTFIWASLWRNPLRTCLTIASIAVSLFVFIVVRAVDDVMTGVARDVAKQLRLVIHERTSLTKLLPVGMGAKLADLPGVQLVCGVRWFGGRLLDNPEQFPSLAVQQDTSPVVYSDFTLTDEAIAAWHADRQAVVVGRALEQRMGWKIGTRLTMRAGFPPYPVMQFRIVGDTEAAAYANFLILRLDYVLDTIRDLPQTDPLTKDTVNFFWVKAASSQDYDALTGRIDTAFSNSPDPILVEPEEAFIAQFAQMFGDIPVIVRSVGWIVLAAMLFVLANTIAIAQRERISDLAILRALGFPTGKVVGAVIGEALLLCALGGGLACLPALLASGLSADVAGSIPYFPTFSVSPRHIAIGLAAAILLGLLAAIGPAWTAARATPAQLLRGNG